MAKKRNKYAGDQTQEEQLIGGNEYLGLGRPINYFEDETAIAFMTSIIATLALTGWRCFEGMDIYDAAMSGIGTALSFFFSFMIAQELDPDRKWGGIIGGALTLVACFFLGEGNILVMMWLLFVLRMLNRTAGDRHRIGDNAIIIGSAAWLGHDGYWLYPLITATAYALETQIPRGYFRSWYLAAITLMTCYFSKFDFLVPNLSPVYIYIMCFAFVVFLPEIRAAAFTEAIGDKNQKRISPRRLQATQGLFMMAAFALTYLHGDSQAQSLLPAYMAAIGCGLYLVPALMAQKKQAK